ncbi:MAG: SRPBCC family protein [Pseudomonadales bacterium]|nr:SRPBCC family protein [Pseudomonadales bacterium]
MQDTFGTLISQENYVTAVMERETDASPKAVWAVLAEESERVKWLAPGTIELKPGGRAELDFKDSYVVVDSEVTACEPEKVLAFSWSGASDPERPVRFEIEPRENGSLIRLTVSIPRDEVVSRSCAGWEAHLTMMQTALAGVPIKFPLERFQACRADFDKQLVALAMTEMPVVRL